MPRRRASASQDQDEDEDAGSGGEELSHRKSDRSVGTGLADDIDCGIITARLSMRSTANLQEPDPDGACYLEVKFESDVEGFETFTEYYSMGKNVVPGDKGKRMMRAPGRKGDFNASCKGARFLDSLTDCGLKEDDQYPYDKLDGLKVHGNRKAHKVEGLEDGPKKNTIFLITDLLDDDTDDEKPKPKSGKKTGAGKKPAPRDEDDDADAGDDGDDEADEKPKASSALTKKAVSVIAKIAKSGPHDDVADVFALAFRALRGDDDRDAIMRDLLNEDDLPAFLKKHADAGGWTFAKGKLSEAD